MSDVITDSCVVAKWLLPEPDSASALRVLDRTLATGSQVIVLDLALPEVANVIWKYYRRGFVDKANAEKLLAALLRAPVRIEPARPYLKLAFELAAKYDRAVYDALVVVASTELGISAITADERLYNAVQNDFPDVLLLKDWDALNDS